MYRVGRLGWKIAARFDVPLLLRIKVVHDEKAKVFIATSPDLAGLVVETRTIDQLFPEVYGCVDMLLTAQLKRSPKSKPIAAWDGDFCPA